MGSLGQTRMPVQDDSLWPETAVTGAGRAQPTLSPREEPSRQRQPAPLSRSEPKAHSAAPPDRVSPETRRPAQILPARRMNIFTIRDSVAAIEPFLVWWMLRRHVL